MLESVNLFWEILIDWKSIKGIIVNVIHWITLILVSISNPLIPKIRELVSQPKLFIFFFHFHLCLTILNRYTLLKVYWRAGDCFFCFESFIYVFFCVWVDVCANRIVCVPCMKYPVRERPWVYYHNYYAFRLGVLVHRRYINR